MKRTRRRVLGTLALPLLAGRTRAGDAGGTAARGGSNRSRAGQADRPAFDPAVHGFGFRNWSTAVPAFPEHDHEAVAADRVRQRVEADWRGPFARAVGVDPSTMPTAALDLVARQLYVSVNQRSATNGHCYGMVFAAQRYYERPDAVPLGREVASEFDNPAVPLDSATEPVAADVDHFQNQQFLDLRSWLGRRSLLLPGRIDYRAQVDALAAAVDEHGTAGITLANRETRRQHQVLVHDYRRRDGGATLFVYEPNVAAADYANRARDDRFRLRVSFGDGRAVEPYGSGGYDAFVFNRHDRAIADAADDGTPTPVGVDDADLGDDLFPAALFLVDSPDVQVSVAGPGGRPVRRDRSQFADRDHTDYHAMRYRYGADPGRYRVAVTGSADADYTLSVLAAGTDGRRLAAEASGSLAAGETHRYVAVVPASADGDGSLARAAGRDGRLGLVGAGVGVAGLAAGGYVALRRRGGSDGGTADGPE